MSTFNPDKLFVEYREGVSPTGPVFPRRYTITHSDITGELFLTIGLGYAWDKTNSMRDEVLGEWVRRGSAFYYCVYLYIDQGEFKKNEVVRRNEIFRRELPLALSAIRYGDKSLFDTSPTLDRAPIIVHFMSIYPQFNSHEDWGTFRELKIKNLPPLQ
ncbi:staygreen family protein [Evansella cellulosilytica]|uniref:Staygreen protein domain-containing protein n=1 Tax=Evansella cellulosilytica (strain ATCC 21833 / DSM 2522 / FERM P-1141 / JCM 9156 / N-4) TaxID=649639 RepID=E6TQH0_EVAC2|nr:staygreen family protein [Evansella cellulosilytica]ADU29348.1 hypothetical protein Bcell_1077 [Evansella cellulosilytica DSM 2522]